MGLFTVNQAHTMVQISRVAMVDLDTVCLQSDTLCSALHNLADFFVLKTSCMVASALNEVDPYSAAATIVDTVDKCGADVARAQLESATQRR